MNVPSICAGHSRCCKVRSMNACNTETKTAAKRFRMRANTNGALIFALLPSSQKCPLALRDIVFTIIPPPCDGCALCHNILNRAAIYFIIIRIAKLPNFQNTKTKPT